jgi:hypothetical protein
MKKFTVEDIRKAQKMLLRQDTSPSNPLIVITPVAEFVKECQRYPDIVCLKPNGEKWPDL